MMISTGFLNQDLNETKQQQIDSNNTKATFVSFTAH
jgi:hypothetical protein